MLLTLLSGGSTATSTKVWLNVSGTWKLCTVWLNVGGTWKTTTVWINVTGTWK